MSMIIINKYVPKIDEETKIPFFAIIFCSLDVLIWIKVEVEKNPRIHNFWKSKES
jgi:hypothetical protein